jgi:hypothetical protein
LAVFKLMTKPTLVGCPFAPDVSARALPAIRPMSLRRLMNGGSFLGVLGGAELEKPVQNRQGESDAQLE